MSLALLSKGQTMTAIETVVFDEKEDTTQITTIDNIVETQEALSSRYSNAAHYDKIWSYKSYFDIAYNDPTKLTPQNTIRTGLSSEVDPNFQVVPTFESDWGASLVLGHNYGLHRPIAGIAKFNIDYSYIDLDVNHFKPNGDKIYDYMAENNGKQYFPWGMEKYEVNYGMALGASLTVAPFTMLKQRGLHFFKFNFFYHVGYHVSAMLALNKTEHYVSLPKEDFKPDPLTLNFGHGMTTSYGARLSWRTIGFGYEHREGKLDYMPLQTEVYGSDHYKFNTSTNRIFIEIRY